VIRYILERKKKEIKKKENDQVLGPGWPKALRPYFFFIFLKGANLFFFFKKKRVAGDASPALSRL
jgi:hypothetical protein